MGHGQKSAETFDSYLEDVKAVWDKHGDSLVDVFNISLKI